MELARRFHCTAIFKYLDTEDVPVKQVIPCLAILLQKRENDIANIIRKTHNFLRKTKNYLKKTPNDLENYIPDFSLEGKEERELDMWVFSAEI